MPLYPLPEDDEKEMLNISFRVLEWLRSSKYKIFIRWHKLQWVGIIEAINFPRMDEGYGRSLDHVYGYAPPNGGRTRFSYAVTEFFEPRYRKLPGSTDLKDTVGAFQMSDLFVFTARNTPTANDDNDDDFTFVANGNVTEKLVAYEQHMSLLAATNSNLSTDIKKQKGRIFDAESRAAAFNQELESAREKLSLLRESNIRLAEQNAELERTNKVLEIENASEQAKMDKQAENAIERGEMAGSSELQQVSKKVDQLDELQTKVSSLYQRGDARTPDDTLKRVSNVVAEQNAKIENLEEIISDIQHKKVKDEEKVED